MPPRVEEIDLPIRWGAGAEEPVILRPEGRCFLAFYLADPPGERTLEDPPRDWVGVLEFVRTTVVTFGFPNMEVLHGHPLYEYGLSEYGAHIVHDSEWFAELQRVEDVHDRPYEVTGTHYVLSFEDSTIEAIAEDLRSVGTFRTMPDAVAHMVSSAGLAPRALPT